MSAPADDYEVSVQVSVYRRHTGGERMSLARNWTVPETNSAAVFRTLAEFSELADAITERENAKHEQQHV
jgi:hypothetical protein